MALTSEQDIPKRPEVKEPWTIRRLFPFSAITSAISKVFVNPLDIILGYLVFILSITELLGRPASKFLWGFAVLILLVKETNYLLEKRMGAKLEDKK